MHYRRLGNTELDVSVVGLGTWQFGGEWGKDFSQAEVNAIFDAARDTGITLIDTAECYGDHLSEQLIGEAIRQDREKWIVATKFGHRFTGFIEREWALSPEAVQQQLEDSLRALQTDVIDLYQFHSGSNEQFDTDGLWTMLDKQKQAGKIRFLGISISSSMQDTNVYQTERAAQVGASVIQVVYNRLERTPETTVFPLCKEQDLGVLARVPLASGFLSGKYGVGAEFPANDVRSRQKEAKLRETLAEVERIQREEVPEGVSMAAWALAWCLKQPIVTSVIPGCKTPEQVRQNAAAADVAA
ncbi:aldo/keto reductase [candidate division KSB3 bacterium]|uniref:Aldo/keto reductase n=1 Tax=candidate division KSB3 bacterium TaxID=2044937 RepID=A0A9D5Q5X0_9BACT|nr:aldo/keto reductase [candidate division KSB3 bacterium]MBD3325080.1 aldo/keto reductase [candidate division KSB3 bacterium]